MNVLSLFDGMACGRIALDRAGISVDRYLASEIDQAAINVAKHNYPTIEHIGDVTKIVTESLPPIDLLIGGSPCQGFSMAGKGLAFNDHRSKLFFEYMRILKDTRPKYFLLENVVMKPEHQEVITNLLDVEPVLINSNLFSAQNRKRLYWTNIPIPPIPTFNALTIKDILDTNVSSKYHKSPETASRFVPSKKTKGGQVYAATGAKLQLGAVIDINSKARCCTAQSLGRDTHILENGCYPNTDIRIIRKLTPTEWERLQTIPIGYTETATHGKRYHMIGNGWTVNVIAHIFEGI